MVGVYGVEVREHRVSKRYSCFITKAPASQNFLFHCLRSTSPGFHNSRPVSITRKLNLWQVILASIVCYWERSHVHFNSDSLEATTWPESVTSEMFMIQDKPVEKIFWVKMDFLLVSCTYMFPKHSDYLIRIIIPNKTQQYTICPTFYYNYYYPHFKRFNMIKWEKERKR